MKLKSCVRAAVILGAMTIFHEAFRAVHTSLWQVRHIFVSYDQRLSAESRKDIETCIHLMENNDGSYNPRTLMTWLRTQFPHIHDVSMRYMPYHIVACTIHACEPCAFVNASHALLANGRLVSASMYATATLAQCPSLTIVMDPLPTILPDRISTPLITALQHEIMMLYRPVLFNDHELCLYDKETPEFYMVCDAMHMPEQKTVAQCQSLKKDLLARPALALRSLGGVGSHAKNQPIQWRADIRFHDQIVVSMEKGGTYGSHIS